MRNQSAETCWCFALVGMEEQSKNSLTSTPGAFELFQAKGSLVDEAEALLHFFKYICILYYALKYSLGFKALNHKLLKQS